MAYKHIEPLTWLRGIAAYLVIISHSLRATEVSYTGADEPSSLFILRLFDLGAFGVGLFFVLSGCSLWISNNSLSGGRDIPTFYIKRLFRIWPAFFVSVLAYIAFIALFKANYTPPLQGYWVEDLANNNFGVREVLTYLSLTFNFTGPSHLINNAYWSLPVEFQFYLLFPLIIYSIAILRTAGPIVIAAALFAVAKFKLIEMDQYHLLELAFTFCGGVLLGYLFTENRLKLRLSWRASLAVCAGCFALVSAIKNGFAPILTELPGGSEWNWYGVAAIITVAAILFSDTPHCDNRFTRFLKYYGEISYSTYLYHAMVLGMAVLLILWLGINDGDIKVLFALLFTSLLTFVIATFSYKHIEMRGTHYGRLISKKLEALSAGALFSMCKERLNRFRNSPVQVISEQHNEPEQNR